MDAITFSILAPAFLAGVAVLLSHVPLGREVLRRGIIFIDLAIAQIAGLGIIVASTMGLDAHGWELQLIAMGSALAGAFALGELEKYVGQFQEAIIGITFVLAATAAILLLAHNPQGGEHLKELLVGQILWVEWSQLIAPLLVGIAIIYLWAAHRRWLSGKAFYYVFAVAVTISVQLVGVYLVFASLILPALSVVRKTDKQAIAVAMTSGAVSYFLGLMVSAYFDLPSGAVIVWSLAVVALLISLLSAANHRAIKGSK